MAASRKLRTAHFLMLLGIAPMVLATAFTAAVFWFASTHPGQGAANDAFLLMAMLLFGYATTLILGGPGALWSWYLTRRGIDKLEKLTVVLRAIIIGALLLPLLWYVTLIVR